MGSTHVVGFTRRWFIQLQIRGTQILLLYCTCACAWWADPLHLLVDIVQKVLIILLHDLNTLVETRLCRTRRGGL